jgi:hypothetical protein
MIIANLLAGLSVIIYFLYKKIAKISILIDIGFAIYLCYKNKYEVFIIQVWIIAGNCHHILRINNSKFLRLVSFLMLISGLYFILQIIASPNLLLFFIETIILSNALMLLSFDSLKIKHADKINIIENASAMIIMILIAEYHQPLIF